MNIKPRQDTRPITGKQPDQMLAMLLRECLLQPHIGDEGNFHAADRDMRHLTSTCVALAEHHPSRTMRSFKWTAPSHPLSQRNYQAGLLAHQLAPHTEDVGPFVDKLLTSAIDMHVFDVCPNFFEDCRDLLWELDVFLKNEDRPQRAVMSAEHRESVLHGLFIMTRQNDGASFASTYEKSVTLLNMLRRRDVLKVIEQMGNDGAILGATAVVAGGATFGTAVTSTTLAKAAVAPFKANTILSLGKAASLVLGSGVSAMLGGGLVVIAAIVGKQTFKRQEDERTVAYADLLGKDLLYLEWMTGRHKKQYRIFGSIEGVNYWTPLGQTP